MMTLVGFLPWNTPKVNFQKCGGGAFQGLLMEPHRRGNRPRGLSPEIINITDSIEALLVGWDIQEHQQVSRYPIIDSRPSVIPTMVYESQG